ncbi:hypothetical protein YPPY32_4900, partial [Yersinia pestis PY-32]
MIPACGPPNS